MEKEKTDEFNKSEIIRREFNRKFDQLAIGQTMYLPLSYLHPISTDDYQQSETLGPIEIFRGESEKLLIDDGNHRYYTLIRELLKIKYNETDPNHIKSIVLTEEDLDLDNFFIEVRKVIPKNDYLLSSPQSP